MTIAEIKSHLPIQVVLNRYNLTLDRNNRLICPWHNDKVPSLQIYPKTNTWTCFSSNCNAGSGDVIDFIMKYERISKHKAIVRAKGLIDPTMTEKESKPRSLKEPTTHTPELTRIAILTKYYQGTLHAIQRSEKARAYAASRGLDHERLSIGFCSYSVGKTWNKDLQQNAEKIGLYKIRNCIIFPTKNKDGQIVSIYGRSISANPKVKHFYLQGDLQGLYPSYPKLDTTKLILTESIIDAATIKNHVNQKETSVLALYGTTNFTEEHRQVIRELELLEEVIFFMDGDEAGKKAIRKWAPEILKENERLKVSYVDTPKDEDINSLICRQGIPLGQGHEPKILSHLIEQRKLVQPSENGQSQPVNTKDDNILFSTEKSIEKRKSQPSQNQIVDSGRLDKPTYTADKLDTTNKELLIYTTTTATFGQAQDMPPSTSIGLKIIVLGGIRITGLDRMKVTLKLELQKTPSKLPIRHTLDLYHARQVSQLIEMMASQLEIRTSRASQIISKLTTALETYRQGRLELIKPKKVKGYELTTAEKGASMTYLKDPHLMINTSRDIAASGIVGEEKNAMIGYVVYLSRKRERPLHVMYLGASGSGKTHVQEGLAKLIPEEEKEEATGMSPQSLYYEGLNLKGKVFFIEDLEGAQDVMYVIRELQTKKKISKKVAVRDNRGNTKTITVTAEGPVVISSCTTMEKLYEDNANRCILLYIDQSKAQDKRVMDYIKAQSSGKIKEHIQDQIRKRMQHVQRTLRPIKVYNPYAEQIDLPPEVFKPRRSISLLIGFIETVTFYHQYQRKVKTIDSDGEVVEPYIETTYEDIKISFDLLKEVLFDKSDELTKAARDFLEKLKKMVDKDDTFYTKKIRKELRMNPSNMKRYMIELQRYDYVKIKSGNRYRGYEYEITDYKEYDDMKSSIDVKLESILLKIKELSKNQK